MATITTNISELKESMTDFEKNQLTFAMSLAINNCLPLIRNDLIQHIESNLTIRNKWLTSKKGVLYNKSNKTTLTAEIYSTAEWLSILNTGGTQNSKTFAVAQTDKYSNKNYVRRGGTIKGTVMQNMRAKVLKASEYYKSKTNKRKGQKSSKLADTDIRGRLTDKITLKGKQFIVRHLRGGKLQFLYALVTNKHYNKKIDAEKAVVDSLIKNFDTQFDKAFDIALLSGN